MHFHDPSDKLLFGHLEVLDELGDVGADDEAVLAACDEEALHAGLRLDEVHGLAQIVEGGLVELVDGVALEVEPQLGDTSVQQGALDGLAVEFHRTSGGMVSGAE